jgi:hypothetical protein
LSLFIFFFFTAWVDGLWRDRKNLCTQVSKSFEWVVKIYFIVWPTFSQNKIGHLSTFNQNRIRYKIEYSYLQGNIFFLLSLPKNSNLIFIQCVAWNITLKFLSEHNSFSTLKGNNDLIMQIGWKHWIEIF